VAHSYPPRAPLVHGTGASWLAGRGTPLRLWPIDARAYATGSATEVAADRARPIGKGTGWYFLLLVKRAASYAITAYAIIVCAMCHHSLCHHSLYHHSLDHRSLCHHSLATPPHPIPPKPCTVPDLEIRESKVYIGYTSCKTAHASRGAY
jgi:hypothetical protein